MDVFFFFTAVPEDVKKSEEGPQTAKGGDETAAQTGPTGQNTRGSIQKMKWERRHLFSHIIRMETLKWNCEERQVLLEVSPQLPLKHCSV